MEEKKNSKVAMDYQVYFWQVMLWIDFWYYEHPTKHKVTIFRMEFVNGKKMPRVQRFPTQEEYRNILKNTYFEKAGMYDWK